MFAGSALPAATLQCALKGGASPGTLRALARTLFLALPGVTVETVGEVDRYRSAQSGAYSVVISTQSDRFTVAVDRLTLPNESWTDHGDLQVAEWVSLGVLTSGVVLDRDGSIRIEIPAIEAVYLYSRMDAIARELGLGSDRIIRMNVPTGAFARVG